MCVAVAAVPAWVMWAGMAASVAGAAVTAKGQIDQGKYQEAVGKNNAIVADQQKSDALLRGEQAENAHRRQVAQIREKQRTTANAAGVNSGVGSVSRELQDTAQFGELDSLMVRHNAIREGYGYDVQATNFLAQSKLDKMKGNYGAAGTILSTGGTVAGDLYNASNYSTARLAYGSNA